MSRITCFFTYFFTQKLRLRNFLTNIKCVQAHRLVVTTIPPLPQCTVHSTSACSGQWMRLGCEDSADQHLPARHINHGGGLLCTQMSLPWSSRATKIQVNEMLDLIAANGQSSLVTLGIMTNLKKQLVLLKVAQNVPKFWLAIYPWTFCQQLNFGTACRSNCRHRTKLIGCTWWAVRYLLLTISIKADSYALLFPDQISRPWSYHTISKSNSLFLFYFIFWVPSSYHGFNSISHVGSQGRFEKCHYVKSWLAKFTEDEEELTLLMLIIIQGAFFDWSALKMTKSQPLQEFSELVLPKKRLRMKKV